MSNIKALFHAGLVFVGLSSLSLMGCAAPTSGDGADGPAAATEAADSTLTPLDEATATDAVTSDWRGWGRHNWGYGGWGGRDYTGRRFWTRENRGTWRHRGEVGYLDTTAVCNAATPLFRVAAETCSAACAADETVDGIGEACVPIVQ